ncbi:MAG: hypothetical protein NTY29_08590, partial [Proteobacteria bacterium]|nr:hypothetical protein [Pseudomonadota bacterium]
DVVEGKITSLDEKERTITIDLGDNSMGGYSWTEDAPVSYNQQKVPFYSALSTFLYAWFAVIQSPQ